jgi:hypothetical protein
LFPYLHPSIDEIWGFKALAEENGNLSISRYFVEKNRNYPKDTKLVQFYLKFLRPNAQFFGCSKVNLKLLIRFKGIFYSVVN